MFIVGKTNDCYEPAMGFDVADEAEGARSARPHRKPINGLFKGWGRAYVSRRRVPAIVHPGNPFSEILHGYRPQIPGS